jgi:hypothetical protein
MELRTPFGRMLIAPALLIAAALAGLAASGGGDYRHEFDASGALMQPPDYLWRQWVYVGTPVTPNSLNPPEAAFPEFHNVYMRPSDFEHWRRTGEFRDGTTLMKELVSVGATQALSGKGFFEGEFVGLEATIKDSKRFASEPGNWGYFTFSHAKPPYPKLAKQQPTAACNACHQQGNQQGVAEDYVFTAYYPVVRAARPGAKP